MNIPLKLLISLLIFLSSISIIAQRKWSLEDCVAYAKENNIEVVKQKISNEILGKYITISKGNYLPNAKFDAYQNFSLGNSFNVSTNVGQMEYSSNSFSLASSVIVFNGFSNKFKLRKSKLSLEKGEVDIHKIRFDLALNITNNYLQVLFNKEILKVAQKQVQISQKNYIRLEKLFKNTLTSKRDFLEIQSAFASDEKEVAIAQNKVKNGLIRLKELLDIKDIANFDIEEITVENLKQKTNVLSKQIIENNPQIQSLKFNINIKKIDIQLSKSYFYPSISLNYSYSSYFFHVLGIDDSVLNRETGLFEENGFFAQLNNNKTHFISFYTSIPIFNRFKTKEDLKIFREKLKISEIELENQRQLLKNQIQMTKNDVEMARVTLSSATNAFIAQNEAFEIIQAQYEKGNVSSFEFLIGKSKLIKTSSDLIKAKYECLFKNKILNFYLTDGSLL